MATEVKQDVLATAASAAPGSTPVVSTSPSGPTSSVRVTAGFTTAPEVGTTGGGSSSKPNHHISSQQRQQIAAVVAASQTQQNQGLSHTSSTSSKTTSQSGVGSGSPTTTSINNPQPASTNVGAGAGMKKSEKQKTMPLEKHPTIGPGHGLKTSAMANTRDREKKIGHRRVDESGVVTYKKKPTSELMAAIQLGIGQSVGGLSSKPERDVLLQDFEVVESIFFPSEGSNLTPAHHYSDFRFKTYAPVAFRYFRELFGIQADDFMLSLCNEPLRELSNPGASGSIFYITDDDEFIIKTVQHKEAEFLQKLLPGYYLNLNQNPRTLLPKFYGLYCYQCSGKNIRFCVMNNLLPSSIKLTEKYDLKGSTHKRKASKHERAKESPTLKDLDFLENHPDGITLEKETYDALIKTIQRDCRVLESFKIMDYSLLVGIYNLDIAAAKEKKEKTTPDTKSNTDVPANTNEDGHGKGWSTIKVNLSRGKSMRTRLAQYSTAMEAIQADTSDRPSESEEDVPPGGIPAHNSKGERLLIYLGLIDILQSYRFKKKLEHTMKAIIIEGDTISVHRPGFYSERFQNFFANSAFKKTQTPLKHSPSKKKSSTSGRPRFPTTSDLAADAGQHHGSKQPHGERAQRTISFSDDSGKKPTMGGKPDIVPDNHASLYAGSESSLRGGEYIYTRDGEKKIKSLDSSGKSTFAEHGMADRKRSDMVYNTSSSPTLARSDMSGAAFPPATSLGHSPPLSLSESTPTHTEYTEGTPSYTTSSPSCSSDVLDYKRKVYPAGTVLSICNDRIHYGNNRKKPMQHRGLTGKHINYYEEKARLSQSLPAVFATALCMEEEGHACSDSFIGSCEYPCVYPGDKWTANSLQTFCDVVLHVTNSQAAAAAAAAATLDDYDDTNLNNNYKEEGKHADVTVGDDGDDSNDIHDGHEGKKSDLAAKEDSKVEDLAAKEDSKVEDLAAKEDSKVEDLAAKEDSKVEDLAAKEDSKVEDLAAKEDRKVEDLAAKKDSKVEDLAAKEKIVEDLAAKEKIVEDLAAKEDRKVEDLAAKENKKAEDSAKEDKKAEDSAKEDKKAEDSAKEDKKAEDSAKEDKKAEDSAKEDKNAEDSAKEDKKAEDSAKGDNVQDECDTTRTLQS